MSLFLFEWDVLEAISESEAVQPQIESVFLTTKAKSNVERMLYSIGALLGPMSSRCRICAALYGYNRI